MPPNRSQNARKSTEQEGRVLLAIEAIQTKQITSIREAARRFDVPLTTLQRRLAGHTNRSETRANGHKLSQIEEESLIRWVVSMDTRGAPPRQSHVRDMANLLLTEQGSTPHQTVGSKWVYNFIQRTPELKTRLSRRYDYQRAQNEDINQIQGWFTLVSNTIAKYGIHSDDIYNFDETGFAMGMIAATRVVTRSDYYGRAKLLQPGNREWVTSIECIGASGYILPPYIIFKAKRHIAGWVDGLPDGWGIDISPNGWTTDAIGVTWLCRRFIPATTTRLQGRYRLLILNGHSSHLTPEFNQICSQNDIIPLCMPAHSSHLLQPLDVSCFSVLKREYSKLVEGYIRTRVNHIAKLDFLTEFPRAHAACYKLDTIKNSFAATSLVPFEPNRVIETLNIRLKTPTPPRSSGSEFSMKTPQNPKQLGKQASSVKALLRRRSTSPTSPTQRAVDQLMKGCEMAMHNAIFLGQQNKLLRNANAKQTIKRAKSAQQLLYRGGYIAREINELVVVEKNAKEPVEPAVAGPSETMQSLPHRAPPQCTECWERGHKRNQCPKRTE